MLHLQTATPHSTLTEVTTILIFQKMSAPGHTADTEDSFQLGLLSAKLMVTHDNTQLFQSQERWLGDSLKSRPRPQAACGEEVPFPTAPCSLLQEPP